MAANDRGLHSTSFTGSKKPAFSWLRILADVYVVMAWVTLVAGYLCLFAVGFLYFATDHLPGGIAAWMAIEIFIGTPLAALTLLGISELIRIALSASRDLREIKHALQAMHATAESE